MAANFPKEIADFMAKFGVTFDEVWKIPQGAAYAVKHKALERVAAEQKIEFEMPQVIQVDMPGKVVGMVVSGKLGERQEWATGEAAPYNNKNSYPLAMAEKRAKDRVILKLLQAHGALYSEDEADDFKEPRKNPHVNRADDFIERPIEYDEQGNPIDNIPNGDPGIERLKVKDARPDFAIALQEMESTVTVKQLQTWGERNANRIASYPTNWAEIFRDKYRTHLETLRGQNGAAA